MTKQQELLNTWGECKRAAQAVLMDKLNAGFLQPTQLQEEATKISELSGVVS